MSRGVRITRRTLLGSTVLAVAAPAFGAAAREIYRDARAPVAARVADLLARMTLEEKAAQLRGLWDKAPLLDDARVFSPVKAAKLIPHGIGQIARVGDLRGFPEFMASGYPTLPDVVRRVNALQRYLVENTRLGIPALFHDELAHGLVANDATVFPIPPALASSFDPDLVEQVFTVAAREARVRGTTIALTPVLDLMRDPRFGRSEEFFGEDPFLVARMGVAAVRGLQGRTRPLAPDRVFATLKHFVHGVPQGGLNTAPYEASERTLRESALVPFETVIREADPAIVMASYNEVEGVPAHASTELLQGTGRGRLGFRGMYSSDYEGINNLQRQHHVAATLEEAAVLALEAGVQTDLPEGEAYAHLPALVRAGRVSERLVDQAVTQVLALKFEAGLFENPYLDLGRLRRDTATPAHAQLARTAAQKALTLLKNDGTLPLAPGPARTLAVIGPNATEPLFGGYSGEPMRAVSILAGLQAGAPEGVRIVQADGVWITAPDARGRHLSFSQSKPVPRADNLARIAQAVEVAKGADVILLVLGDTPAITREAVAYVLPGDRSTLGLWGEQDALVEAMAALGKPIVALLLNGRPLATPRLAEVANALIEGWYLGQEGGTAFADVLFGRAEPGGRLPVSLPRSVGELPVYYGRHPSADNVRYIESAHTALFPFGHGLSYTTFEIGAPRLPQPTIGRYQSFAVEVDVANVGTRAGEEVVQLYIRDTVSSVPRPTLELRGFQRVALEPGERRIVRFELAPDALAFWDIHMERVVEPGTFTISVGRSSAKLKSASLTVTA